MTTQWVDTHVLLPWWCGVDITVDPSACQATTSTGAVRRGLRVLPVFASAGGAAAAFDDPRAAAQHAGILDKLGDVTLCARRRAPATDGSAATTTAATEDAVHAAAAALVTALEQALADVGFANERAARALYERAITPDLVNWSGATRDEVHVKAQFSTRSADETVFALVGVSKTHIAVTVRLRLFPERIKLLQIMRESERQPPAHGAMGLPLAHGSTPLLRHTLARLRSSDAGVQWLLACGLLVTDATIVRVAGASESNRVGVAADSLVAKIVHETRRARIRGELSDRELVARVLFTLSALPRAAADAANSELYGMWQRLAQACLFPGLGNGDPDTRVPQAMWRKVFECAALDGGAKRVFAKVARYCEQHAPDSQLVAYAGRLATEPEPTVPPEDVDAAERTIVECMRGWRLAPLAGCVVRPQQRVGACAHRVRPGCRHAARLAA